MKRTIIYLLRILLILLLSSLPAYAQQAAVNDSINAPFKAKNLNVQVWVKRFEVEGREVYDYRNQIVNAIGLKPGQQVADVGAGTGLFEPLLASKVGTGAQVGSTFCIFTATKCRPKQ